MTRKDLVARVREGLRPARGVHAAGGHAAGAHAEGEPELSDPELSERQVNEVIDRALAEMAGAIQRDGKLTLPGFGTFTVRHTAARVGRHPRTGEVIEIEAGTTVGFKPAAELKAGLG